MEVKQIVVDELIVLEDDKGYLFVETKEVTK